MVPRPVKQKARQPKKRTRRKKNTIEDRIEDIDSDGNDIKIALYGKSGSGKTTLWSTFPGPILALICSGRKNPGELKSVNTPQIRKKAKKITIEQSSDMWDIIDYQKDNNRFKTIVLDHATAYQDLVLKEVLDLEEMPVQKSWGLAKRQDFQVCSQQVKEVFRGLLNLDCNIVIVCQEREFKNSEEDEELIAPHVSTALMPTLTIYLDSTVDYICQTFKRNKMVSKTVSIRGKKRTKLVRGKGVEYCLRTGPNEVYQTKFRMPITQSKKLPEEIVDPNYSKMIKLIEH